MGLVNMLCAFIGTVFPAYASFKAIESPDPEDDKQWLTYWVIYATILLAETWVGWLIMWIPFYSVIKLGVILWLIAPGTQGAKSLYVNVVRPFLVRHASKFDPVFAGTRAVINLEVTSRVARLVETHGPAAAETVTHLVFKQENISRLAKLAKTDPALVQRVFQMAVDAVSNQGSGASQASGLRGH